jgi:hypothetical protein
MLNPETLPAIQRALADAELDGLAAIRLSGCESDRRRDAWAEGHDLAAHFHLDPARGVPHALGHAIEPGPWETWPTGWTKGSYSSWRSLESAVSAMVKDKRIAMEYSAGDAVPYLDRVPAGVIEMVRAAARKVDASSGSW